MRIFFCELKKLWNWRIIAVIIALGALAWFAVLPDSFSSYDSLTTHGIYGKYKTEMFGLYGEELSAEELLDYDITFRQYAIVLAAISLAFSVGAACFASVIARFSANLVTLMIKAVPTGTAVATIAALALVQSLSSSSLLISGSIARITGCIPYIEVIVCAVL